MGPGGRYGLRGPGDVGTVTGISGTTLTLRTENGTETVDTSSSTTYVKERQTISFSDIKVNDVVRVVPVRSSTSSTSPPPTPGTGTVDAQRIMVVEPALAGRVQSVTTGSSGDTITVVGPEGQLLTVTTSGTTRYYRGRTQVTASAVTTGARIVAQGSRTGLKTLSADLVVVMPNRPPVPPAGGTAASAAA